MDTTERKRGKRGNGEGSIYQRKDGRWVGALTLSNGKRKAVYGSSWQEAKDKLRQAERDQENGLDLSAKPQTVAQFLDRWIVDVVTPTKAAKTTATYADIVRLHLKPGIGRHQLAKLTPQHVAALLKAKQDARLSPRMVHHLRAVLRSALNQAMRWGLVTRNVASLVASPRQTSKEVKPLSVDEARAILAAAESDRLSALFRLALTLGLRQGEALGLKWEDVDLDKRTLKVRHALQRINGRLILKEPKTEKSRRTLTLPPSMIAALKAHRDRQAFERAATTDHWQETGLVFTTTLGTPVDPRNAIRSWHRIQRHRSEQAIECAYRAANSIDPDAELTKEQEKELAAILGDRTHPLHAAHALPRHNFHSTRHTAASLLLAEGVPVKVVQEVLGHSLISTTADLYAHLFPEAFAEAADAMERALAAAG
jgi:integrase